MKPVKRPKPGETEDDLLRMQEEFIGESGTGKAPVQVRRVSRKTAVSAEPTGARSQYGPKLGPSKCFTEGGRFTIDLDKIEEERTPQQVVFGIQERNVEVLDVANADAVNRMAFDKLQYSKEDGFPEARFCTITNREFQVLQRVLRTVCCFSWIIIHLVRTKKLIDLSAYYKKDAVEKHVAPSGMSFFAAEFDRIHGRLEESAVQPSCSMEEDEIEPLTIDSENVTRLEGMSRREIDEARAEIEEKLDPKLIEFLKNRHKLKKMNIVTEKEEKKEEKSKVSRFKKERQNEPSVTVVEPPKDEEAPVKPVVSDMIKQLEVLEEYADMKNEEKYSRLATDAVQLDFAAKCARSMLPRQAQNAMRLFEMLKHRPDDAAEDYLLEKARSQIDEVKLLYLEEIKSGDKTFQQFAKGLNPVVDGCWMLRPIRTVVDAVQARENQIVPDDVEICRLCLLWSTLLLAERPTIFHTMVDVNDFYVRLAEVYILGLEVFKDDVVRTCVNRLIDQFVIPRATEGRLSLRLARPVAGLDAFMPFYEDLLKKFEEFSVGDPTFTKLLLIAAYLNNALSDAMECKVALWSKRRNVIRETTATPGDLATLLPHLYDCNRKLADIWEEQYYVQYSVLLSEYAASMKDGRIERDRNRAVYDIAVEELGRFVQRHTRTVDPPADPSTQKLKQFDALVALILNTVEGVVNL